MSSAGCAHLSSADSSSVWGDVSRHTHSAAACHFSHLVVSVAPQGESFACLVPPCRCQPLSHPYCFRSEWTSAPPAEEGGKCLLIHGFSDPSVFSTLPLYLMAGPPSPWRVSATCSCAGTRVLPLKTDQTY